MVFIPPKYIVITVLKPIRNIIEGRNKNYLIVRLSEALYNLQFLFRKD